MTDTEIKRIVIVGSGAATSAAAAAVAFSLRGSGVSITLLELPGAAEVPVMVFRGGMKSFHTLLGISEENLLTETGGAFSLGTRYRGFRKDGKDVLVPLGSHGRTLRLVDFHHYAMKLRSETGDLDYNAYSLPAIAATNGRFKPPGDVGNRVTNTVDYELRARSDRYTTFMLNFAKNLGIEIVNGSIAGADINNGGAVGSVILTNGQRIAGDFFIDTSNNRSLCGHLPGANAFQDWSHWLQSDRTASVLLQTPTRPELVMTIDANDHGWVQGIEVADVTVCSFVYASRNADTEIAHRTLGQLPVATATADLQIKELRCGSYASNWIGNCVAIGPAAATLEPLEVFPIQLLQSSLLRLLAMLPRKKISPMIAQEFDRVTSAEIASARDYAVLRYALSSRTNGPFWKQVRSVGLPATLQQRIDLFSSHGRLTSRDHEFFSKASWVSSFINFGHWPSAYDPLADMIDEHRMRRDIGKFGDAVQRLGESM